MPHPPRLPLFQPLLTDPFLRAHYGGDFQHFRASGEDERVRDILDRWARRDVHKETSDEAAFLDIFFKGLWGYVRSGEGTASEGYTAYPRFRIARAGAGGGTGEADLALGLFGRSDVPAIPQAVCEFKDIRSDLDSPQRRKADTRSPVKQCADYLREVWRPLFGNEPIQPHWGIVTDMNEFRLYWRRTMPTQCQRFVIRPKAGDEAVSLLGSEEEASFQRFLFVRLFHADSLISASGKPRLLALLEDQRFREREIEAAFYAEYRAFRERLYTALVASNPGYGGTRGRLVRLAQKILDRCIFILFCEDMGRTLDFPPDLLRNLLSAYSRDRYYDPSGGELWERIKRLFRAMDEGGEFFGDRVNRFNGGLFADDPELNGLRLPNDVFCAHGQAESEDSLRAHPATLLYFSASYNFGVTRNAGRAITLYTLGRIFEQSITELEIRSAEVEGRESLGKLGQRKRDGVYYTPEWVVEKIVEETLGARLADLRRECGWYEDAALTDEEILQQISRPRQQRQKLYTAQIEAVRAYQQRLGEITVVDPACGSGAFLIHSLDYLLREGRRVRQELNRLRGETFELFDDEAETRRILADNLYGVDVNPASVEIAKLALWLHTARADRALCDLDRHIRDGNSLIGPHLYEWRPQLELLPNDTRERINAFDWEGAFPEVFARGGFDCVVGNPPYVKLQNFRRVYPEVAEYLRAARRKDGAPVYRSAQSGNFDLFLPFIEKGLALLNAKGRLGYIAPSLWRYNEYGAGLRQMLRETRQLDRWIDFGDFQVFEEAINYTALQFYSRDPNPAIRFALAPDGDLAAADLDDPDSAVPYAELPADPEDAWPLLPARERALLNRLAATCDRLDDANVTTAIFQGLITSADRIYHLRRLGPGAYRTRDGAEVAIEDALMRPLVSGEEAKRYLTPETDTYILFPYDTTGNRPRLHGEAEMARRFPRGWAYLRAHETELRARERGRMNADDRWWGYNYPKNLDKQDKPKLMVPRLVARLGAAVDENGSYCLDNVDVGGVMVRQEQDLHYVLAVLNSRMAEYVWQRISKPFQNGFRAANRQFIAPLPVPRAPAERRAAIGRQASALQRLHTERHRQRRALDRRLAAWSADHRGEDWLWPALGSLAHWKAKAPATLGARDRTAWAREHRDRARMPLLQRIESRLRPAADLDACLDTGELRFVIDGVAVVDGVFVSADEGGFVLAQWRHLARSLTVTAATTALHLAQALWSLRRAPSDSLRQDFVDREAELRVLERQIAAAEAALDDDLLDLYGLSDDERRLLNHA